MILDGNQRGGGRDLAIHLMKPENERVSIIEMRGYASDTLMEAFVETYAISRATNCKQYLYSLSINPPAGAEIDDADYLDAANRAEKELGLTGQPRAIVRHWKRDTNGVMRPHAHVVWSRIDVEQMKAVHLPFTKKKLREVSRDLHIRHNLKMPDGLINSKDRDPDNFTLEAWQQSKRAGKNIRQLQSDFKDAWALSDSPQAFAHALAERGYVLAQGRRGHVAVDDTGEVYAVRTYVGLKPKEVRARLGDPSTLPSVEEAQMQAAKAMADRLSAVRKVQQEALVSSRQQAQRQEADLETKHERQRKALAERHERQRGIEYQSSSLTLRTGLPGFWDWMTGKRARILSSNRETAAQNRKDRRKEWRALQHRQRADRNANRRDRHKDRLEGLKGLRALRADLRGLTDPPAPQPSKPSRRRQVRRKPADEFIEMTPVSIPPDISDKPITRMRNHPAQDSGLADRIRRNPALILSQLTERESTFTEAMIAKVE